MREPLRLTLLLLALALLFLPKAALAQTPACDALQGAKRDVAQAVLRSQHPYECCTDTIAACLNQKPVCRLAKRLANDVCRRAGAGQDQAAIEQALSKRAASMSPSATTYPIDLSHSAVAGDNAAKVTVVGYVCSRCPFCARLTPQLYRMVTDGALKGKARLFAKAFPVRSHANATEGDMSLLAAEKLGQFWPYALQIYQDFDKFDPSKLADVAASKGMNREEFARLLGDPEIRNRLVESKKEGVRNQVNATPTLFINGRRYTGDLDPAAVQDVIEEEFDRVTGRIRE